MKTQSAPIRHHRRDSPKSSNPNRQKFADRVVLGTLFTFLILKPFYFWESGLPQIADLLMVGLIFTSAALSRFHFSKVAVNPSFLHALTTFTYYTVFVNITAMLLMGGSNSFLITSLYYVYNALVAVSTIAIVQRAGATALRVLFYGALTSSAIQSVIVTIGGSSEVLRSTGTFNNPNQLAYFGLLTSALFLLVGSRVNIPTVWLFTGLLSSTYLILGSLSKAGLLAQVILIGLFIPLSKHFQGGARRTAATFLLSFIFTALFFTNIPALQTSALLQNLQTRISTPQDDDSLLARGYGRLTDYPEYWLFGAGEGGYGRFGDGIEFHSTLGNIQVSYGIVGTSLLVATCLVALRANTFRDSYIMVALMVYGLAHNGIRNPLFWILVALIVAEPLSNRRTIPTSGRLPAERQSIQWGHLPT